MVFLLRLVPFLQRFIDNFFLGFIVKTGEGLKEYVFKLANELAVGKIAVLLLIYVPGNEPVYVNWGEIVLTGLGNVNAGVGNRCGNGKSLFPFLLYIFLSGGGSGLGVINFGIEAFLNFLTGIIYNI
jgi:hypothetical protein